MRFWVDSPLQWPLSNEELIQIVRKAPEVYNVRQANKYGWSNMPKVVTFSGNELTTTKWLKNNLPDTYFIREKDW